MTAEQLFHPDFAEASEIWQTIEDVCGGGRPVKARGVAYLPKLSGQSNEDYQAMKLRADFFAATKRTREALVGMLLRKPVAVDLEASPETEELTKDVDLEGSSLRNYIRKITEATVGTGRSVSIIDWSDEEKRPVLCFYPATSVLNWATKRVEGRNVLGLLVLRESVEVAQDLTIQKSTKYREFRLNEANQVEWREWTETNESGRDAGGEKSTMDSSDFKPMARKGRPLTRIPAVFHNSSHLGPDIGPAPLIDIADLNLSHYRSSADLENGRHIAGIPTPYATGIDDDNSSLFLGSNHAWTASDPQARFGFLEFTGQGLGVLENALKDKERQMAVLGARLLFDQKQGVEAFDTVALRAASETAALSNISGYLSSTLTSVVQWLAWWGTDAKSPNDIQVSIVVNDDFVPTEMDATTLAAYVAAFQADAISFETFYSVLEKGEVYPDGWDMEREIAAISGRPPVTRPAQQSNPPTEE